MKYRVLPLLLALCLTLSPAALARGDGTRAEALTALGILPEEIAAGAAVTRGQFARMLVNASAYRDSAEGYGASLYRDLKQDHPCSGAVRVAVEQGWMSGFLDGSFRPDQAVTLEEGCAALLKLLGFDAAALKGAYPAAQLAGAGSAGLLDGVSAGQGDALSREDCAALFYNLLTARTSAGAVYGSTLGYSVTNGQVDYASLVAAGTEGPCVAESAALSLPFTPRAVYRNGAASALSAVQPYDVYYYNETMRTVWVYHDRPTGTVTALTPSAAAPTAVTVAGVSYSVGTAEAACQLSSQGQFREGDVVTLLLGMNGEVVRVIAAGENQAVYLGVVTASAKAAASAATSSASSAGTQVTTRVICTDGVERTFYHSGEALAAGKLVTVSSTQSGTAVRSLSAKRLEGTVSEDGGSFAGYDFAAGVQILDTNGSGGCVRVYPSRLAGVRLSGEDVCCYTLDAAGDIDRLILQNVTGDTEAYVYVSQVEDSSGGGTISVGYTYLQNGQTHSLRGSAKYPADVGGAVLVYEKGSLWSIRQLTAAALDSLDGLSALGDGKAYPVAEDVQVLLREGSGGYYLTDLSRISAADYQLTGWYDDLGYAAGGRIRVLVAAVK